MKKARAIEPSSADREALEKLARRGGRAGLRARIVLSLAGGASVAGTARTVRVTEKTVRAARARFLASGADGLRDRPRGGPKAEPSLRVTLLPELTNWKADGARGRPPRARRKIETWVRDCAALGLVRPGARLPDRAWFRERFHAAPSVLQAAFDALAEQGFVRTVPRGATFLARRLPFEGRYLLGVLPTRKDENREGLDAALIAAARRMETSSGVKWDVCDIVPPSHPGYLPTLFRIASQRYAGVFLRTAVRMRYDPGRARWFASVDNVPICVVGDTTTCADGRYGSLVRFLADGVADPLALLFGAVRRAGCRRAMVLGAQNKPTESAAAEADALAAAAAAGVEVPSGFYQCVNLFAPLQTRRLLGLALTHQGAAGLDAVVCMQDNYAPIVCEELATRLGGAAAAARRFKVFSLGSCPSPLRCMLPVTWCGDDWDASLDDFVRWCSAVHDGNPDAPPPRRITR